MSTPETMPCLIQPIGSLLERAGLITSAQVAVVLQDQTYCGMRFGDILAARGWLQQQTVDFFVEQWPQILQNPYQTKLGECLCSAALLDETQVQTILKEQWQCGFRFGAVAVLNGWVKQATIDFMLEGLAPQRKTEPPVFINAAIQSGSKLTSPPTPSKSVLAEVDPFDHWVG